MFGGIYANDAFPADYIADNLAIGLNVIRGSFEAGVRKVLALGHPAFIQSSRRSL